MPVKRVLSLCEEIKLNRLPECIYAVNDQLLGCDARIEVLPEGDQPLDEKRTLNQVTAVILLAERHDTAGGPVQPVRPDTVITVTCLKKIKNFVHVSKALRPGNEPPLHCHNHGHDAKSGASGGDNVTRSVALPRKPAGRMRKVIEISEGLTLNQIKQFIVTYERKLGTEVRTGVKAVAETVKGVPVDTLQPGSNGKSIFFVIVKPGSSRDCNPPVAF